MIKIKAHAISYPLHSVFRIARGAKTEAHCLRVELEYEGKIGRGEAVPYARYDQTMQGELNQLFKLRVVNLEQDVRELLPASAARNALDCALWDLRAKLSGKSVAEMLDLTVPKWVRTAQTLSLDTPEAMYEAALALPEEALIKVKLGGDEDAEAMKAVRDARPFARLIVDANEGWNLADYEEMVPILQGLGVEMIEQPFHASQSKLLKQVDRAIPICADESLHTSDDLIGLLRHFDMINIKLDKTGGLTEAAELVKSARELNVPFMIGCMVGSSLGMAPAYLLTEHAKYVDLDGPLFLAEDEQPAIEYSDGIMSMPSSQLWGN